MRIRPRATTATAMLAAATLALSLSGCVTVRGAEAIVPAVSEKDAQQALERYADVKNEANPAYDAELNDTAETGTLAEINSSVFTARTAVTPDGNPDYEPLEFSDPSFHIPRQAGWPKFFLADTATNRSESNNWLLLFTRDSVEADWRVSYMASVPAESIPEFAEDEDGYVVPLSNGGGDGAQSASGGELALTPGELSGAYTDYLQDGEGPFADGGHTSGEIARRAEANQDAASAVQYLDSPATEEKYQPVGLELADGGGLAFFTSHHSDQETWADGETPVIDQYVEAVLEGDASQSVTTERLSLQTALIPADETEPVTVIARMYGVISATGK